MAEQEAPIQHGSVRDGAPAVSGATIGLAQGGIAPPVGWPWAGKAEKEKAPPVAFTDPGFGRIRSVADLVALWTEAKRLGMRSFRDDSCEFHFEREQKSRDQGL